MTKFKPTIIRKFVWWWRGRPMWMQNIILVGLLFAMVYAIQGICFLVILLLRIFGVIK